MFYNLILATWSSPSNLSPTFQPKAPGIFSLTRAQRHLSTQAAIGLDFTHTEALERCIIREKQSPLPLHQQDVGPNFSEYRRILRLYPQGKHRNIHVTYCITLVNLLVYIEGRPAVPMAYAPKQHTNDKDSKCWHM